MLTKKSILLFLSDIYYGRKRIQTQIFLEILPRSGKGCIAWKSDHRHVPYRSQRHKNHFTCTCGSNEGKWVSFRKRVWRWGFRKYCDFKISINVHEVWSSGISCKKEKKAKKCSQRVADDLWSWWWLQRYINLVSCKKGFYRELQ